MSSSTTERKQVKAETESTNEEGPVVLHVRTLTDEHSYIAFGDRAAAEAFQGELQTNQPGKFDFEVLPATTSQELLDKNPPQPSEEEQETPQTVAQASAEQHPAPGIPDSKALNQMDSHDLTVLAAGLGLDADDYDSREELVEAIEGART